MTRKQKTHENTREEIKAIAWRQIELSGADQLSLGSIAREMGLTTPALYRYFASRNELVSALVLDAHHSFAAALEQAIAGQPVDAHAGKFRALCQAYRRWALEHPQPYSLLFGNPIPGYQLENEAGQAAERSFVIVLDTLQAAQAAGVLDVQMIVPESPIQAASAEPTRPYQPEVMHLALAAWSFMHGMTSLELNGQSQVLLGADTGAFAEIEISRLMRSSGLA